ncbi:MAG: hypothetical protein V4773_28150 [Verrucomicrobiota bacterium]
MSEGFFSWLVKQLFGAVLDAALDFMRERDNSVAREEKGAATVAAAVNKESADALARMSLANASPRGRAAAIDRLSKGDA